LFGHFMLGGAVTRADVSNHQKRQLQPFETKIVTERPGFTVARTSDNTPAGSAAHFRSEALAREYLNQQVATDPKLAQELHVIPQYEVNNSL
jgi:hypothetical protein